MTGGKVREMDGSLHIRSEVFDQLHPTELPPRPNTVMSGDLHSSSIRIVDHRLIGTNPHPNVTQGRVTASDLSDQFLSPCRLREVAGTADLSKVSYLELSVNTSTTSLGNFGSHLPNLVQLSLFHSVAYSVRDLGTSLGSLRVLWMAGCGLRDLDGLAALPSLQELYVANNDISDVSLISLSTEIEVLDLERNQITDYDQLGYLCLCPNLTILTLSGNPLQNILSESKDYRQIVHESIPQLKVLDETPFEGVDTNTLSSTSSYSLFSASMVTDWRDVNKGLLSPALLQEKEVIRKRPPRSTSAILAPSLQISSEDLSVQDSSELTHGLNQVLCGNPVRALRARQQRRLTSQSMISPNTSFTSEELNLSLENEGISLTKTSSLENLLQASPPPPPPPPSENPLRPHTASEFRLNRYKKPHIRSHTAGNSRDPDLNIDKQNGRTISTSPDLQRTTEQNVLLSAKIHPIRTRRVYINHFVS